MKHPTVYNMTDIQTIVKSVPSDVFQDDDAVREYVLQILQDEQSYDDLESLQETLEPFLGSFTKKLIETIRLNLETSRGGLSFDTLAVLARRDVATDSVQSNVATANDTSTKLVEPETKLKMRRKEARQQKKHKATTGNEEKDALIEDASSAWRECQEAGQTWGGRGKGGRGEYAGAVNSVKSNIHLTNVSISLDNGLELLQNSTMDIVRGRRYGLIGRNGVGKSTLLRRLANKQVPGMPHDMRVLLVQQQIEGSDETSLDALVKADVERTSLLKEQEEAEARLEADDVSDEEIESIALLLGDIAMELDAISADTAEERAEQILKGLQFTNDMIFGSTKNLSGGWRMRLALAKALYVRSDLLALDEVSNHLDLHGLDWLINYLNSDPGRTLMVVSHDRVFLDAICTDIVVLEHQRLSYHVGNISEYQRQMQEKAAREGQILDAAERQRAKAQQFIQKQQSLANKKNADPNKQRQAKMMKEKKLDRIGNYREDGKRYKLNSLKKLSEDHIRLAQKVQIEVDDPVIKMYFPNPTWPPGITPNDAVIRLEEFSFSFEARGAALLDGVTLSVNRGSKIALVGRNGAGKSSLMKLLAGDMQTCNFQSRGTLWTHQNVRIGHVTQYSVEELEEYSSMTVIEYAEEKLTTGQASAEIVAKASGNVRQYLGAFGLGDTRHAHQKIGKLSGGERMRLCFATVLAEAPHVLCLDESTNHVDLETLDSMSMALNAFKGSVVMVSHNQAFLSGFCNELWVLDQGKVTVSHSDTATFDEIFSNYRNSVVKHSVSLAKQRKAKAVMAKQATKQRVHTRQNAALL